MLSESLPLTTALLQDQRERWRRGERVLVESYLAQHPELASNTPALLELIDAEISLREEFGESPQPEEYLSRFSSLQAPLSEFLSNRRWAPDGQTHAGGSAATKSVKCPFCTSDLDGPLFDQEGKCDHCGREIHLLSETISLRFKQGRLIGAFELQRLVGRGNFGEVWLARDSVLQRDVAIKVPRGLEQDSSSIDRFLREARAAARLQHPNLVSVYETGYHEGVPYIASAFIHGTHLQDLIDRRKISLKESAAMLQTIAAAVAHAHAAGILHRDLKPANVLVDSAGVPYVADFGLAKNLSSREATLTMEGQLVGTPAYMSPEQARADVLNITAASDIYALGVILYELITHQRPFNGERESVLHQIRTEEPVPPRKHNPAIPRDLETICLKAMSKLPADRYASAQELADDLGRFLKGELIRAKPVTLLERTWRRARKVSPAIAVLATACVVLSVMMALYANQSPLTPDENNPDNSAERPEYLPGSYDPPDPAVRQKVAIQTEPAGAKVVCYPLDYATGRVDYSQRVVATNPTPTQVELVNGLHLVVAYIDDEQFQEVFRTATTKPLLRFSGHAHERWEYDSEQDVITWPTIRLNSYKEDEESLAFCPGGAGFNVDMSSFGGGPERWSVPSFYLETTEVTAAKHARFDVLKNFNGARHGSLASSGFSWNDAVAYAEVRGMRVPDFLEGEWAATNGGERTFPWGEEPPGPANWDFDEPVDGRTKDTIGEANPITGLYSRTLEWTSTRAGRDPKDPGFRLIVRGGPIALIDPRIGEQRGVYCGPVNQFTRHMGLGVRCARSPRPRLNESDFVTRDPNDP